MLVESLLQDLVMGARKMVEDPCGDAHGHDCNASSNSLDLPSLMRDEDCPTDISTTSTSSCSMEDSKPCIIYMGRSYPANIFEHSSRVFESELSQELGPTKPHHVEFERKTNKTIRDTDIMSQSCPGVSSRRSNGGQLRRSSCLLDESSNNSAEHVARKLNAQQRHPTSSGTVSPVDDMISRLWSSMPFFQTSPDELELVADEHNADDGCKSFLMKQFQYNHEDIGEWIVDNPVAFAKMKRDLRRRHAITDMMLKERLHIFLLNTKCKGLQEQQQDGIEQHEQSA